MDVENDTDDNVVYEVDDGTGPGDKGLRFLLTDTYRHLCSPPEHPRPSCAGRLPNKGDRITLLQFQTGNTWKVRFFEAGDLAKSIASEPNRRGDKNQKLIEPAASVYEIVEEDL